MREREVDRAGSESAARVVGVAAVRQQLTFNYLVVRIAQVFPRHGIYARRSDKARNTAERAMDCTLGALVQAAEVGVTVPLDTNSKMLR